jgi:hypothetical protein
MADKGRYWELEGENATAQAVDNVLSDLTDILTEGPPSEKPENVAVIWVEGDSEGDTPKERRDHFELGEAGGGAHVDANLREIIVGDGEGNARGGSRDNEQGNETLYIEHLDVCDESDLPLLTHYIYSPNMSTNTRFAFGEKYSMGSSKKMPSGNFMMVEGDSFIKAKGRSWLTLSGSSEIRVSSGSQATVANGSQVNVENNAKVHIFGAGDSTEVDITKGAKVRIHGGAGGPYTALL